MQIVAEITEPLNESDGKAARGSESDREACLWGPVRLMRRNISWPDAAPAAASLGDWAVWLGTALTSWVKYDLDVESPLLPEA
jgi:hypothetical protein